MNNSRPPSRSSSRNKNRSNPPGVLAVSSTMLANANQSQNQHPNGTASVSKSKRSTSKSASAQRRPEASATGVVPDLIDLTDVAPSSTRPAKPSGLAGEPQQLGTKEQANTLEAAASTTSLSKRRGKKKSAMNRPDEWPASRPGLVNTGYATSDAEEAIETKASTPARPQHRRRISSSNLSMTASPVPRARALPMSAAPQDRPAHIDTGLTVGVGPDSTSATFSKSAPASSFLEGVHGSTRKRGKRNNNSTNTTKDPQQPTRSSNSADEWDMPSNKLIQGNDVLTWQQQASVTRSTSQNKKASAGRNSGVANGSNNATFQLGRKQPTYDNHADISVDTSPSGLSNAMAAGAALDATNNAQVEAGGNAASTLTWQQALLQRSAPATPAASNIFEALEQGHTGARPASDYAHQRTRSSPAKPARSVAQPKAFAAHNESDEDARLDKQLGNLSFGKVNPPAQSKTAKKSKPIPILPSGPADQRSVVDFDNDAKTSTTPVFPKTVETRQTKSAAATPITAVGSSASPTKSALYAGPKFHNSPSAGQLPTPKLAAFLNRNREATPALQSKPVGSSPSSEAIFA